MFLILVNYNNVSSNSHPNIVSIELENTQTMADLIREILVMFKVDKVEIDDYRLYELTRCGINETKSKTLLHGIFILFTPMTAWECPTVLCSAGERIGLYNQRCQFVLRHKSASVLKG